MTNGVTFQNEPLNFSWKRGKPRLWRISVDRQNRRWPRLEYLDDWPGLTDDSYEPGLDALVDFAELGRQALLVGREADARSGIRILDADGKEVPVDDQTAVLFAPNEAVIRKRVLQFVRAYGAPWRAGTIPLPDILNKAALLSACTRMAIALQESPPPLTADKVPDGYWRLLGTIREQLGERVYLVPGWDSKAQRPVIMPVCEDLHANIWMQLLQVLAADMGWRICEGCQCLFPAEDKRRRFHDTKCRNRTAQRARRQQKGK